MAKTKLNRLERKILVRLSHGHTRKEICKELNISLYNCKKLINSACKKYNTTSLLYCIVKALCIKYKKSHT